MLTVLKSRRGETLVESITSILIFTILMAAVTTIILVSLRISGMATSEAAAMQNEANAVLRGDGTVDGINTSNIVITFSIVGGPDMTVNVTETRSDQFRFVAFQPAGGP